jgi:hypothetical protein
VGGDLQPVVSVPSRPHGAGRIPDHGVRGRGGGRVASAGRSAQRGRARDVLDGDVDGTIVAPLQIVAGDCTGSTR